MDVGAAVVRETTDDFCASFVNDPTMFASSFARMVGYGSLPDGVDPDDTRVRAIRKRCVAIRDEPVISRARPPYTGPVPVVGTVWVSGDLRGYGTVRVCGVGAATLKDGGRRGHPRDHTFTIRPHGPPMVWFEVQDNDGKFWDDPPIFVGTDVDEFCRTYTDVPMEFYRAGP